MPDRRSRRATGEDGSTRVRPQLDAATIVDTALRLAGDGSTEPLTVRRLGAELGADPTAIYRHFRDKDALVVAVLDRLYAEAVEAVDPAAGWRERLLTFTARAHAMAVEIPGIIAVSGSTSTGGPGELRAIELLLSAMQDAGLDRSDTVRYYAVLSSYVLSFTSATARSMLTGERAADASWVNVASPLDVEAHPTLTALRQDLEALHDDDVYEVGVHVILDAIEARGAR